MCGNTVTSQCFSHRSALSWAQHSEKLGMVLFGGLCFLEAGVAGRFAGGTFTSTPVEGLVGKTGAH